MSNIKSCGILVYKIQDGVPKYLLAHPGGPYYWNCTVQDDKCIHVQKLNAHSNWFIPKGRREQEQQSKVTAVREFYQQTGVTIPQQELTFICQLISSSGQVNDIWSAYGDYNTTAMYSNNAVIRGWPSQEKQIQFPQMVEYKYFTLQQALTFCHKLHINAIYKLHKTILMETYGQKGQLQ